MILCKYSKTGGSVYVPHLDILREVGRAVRRANLNVSYSEGFNPHMLLFFSQPLPLGMKSESEYFCAVSNEEPTRFMRAMNEKLPRGIRILGATLCNDANVYAQTEFADYRYTFGDKRLSEADLNSIMSRIEIKIPLKTKKGVHETDIRPRIRALALRQDAVVATLTCGRENNLRADTFGAFLAEELHCGENWDVVKQCAYALRDGKLVGIDELYGVVIP